MEIDAVLDHLLPSCSSHAPTVAAAAGGNRCRARVHRNSERPNVGDEQAAEKPLPCCHPDGLFSLPASHDPQKHAACPLESIRRIQRTYGVMFLPGAAKNLTLCIFNAVRGSSPAAAQSDTPTIFSASLRSPALPSPWPGIRAKWSSPTRGQSGRGLLPESGASARSRSCFRRRTCTHPRSRRAGRRTIRAR